MVERVTVILGFCSTGVFLGLAAIGVRRVLRGSAADRWLAGCFASLAAVLLAGLLRMFVLDVLAKRRERAAMP